MDFKKILLFLSLLFVSTSAFSQSIGSLHCTDEEVRELIELTREAGYNKANTNILTSNDYQGVIAYIGSETELGASESEGCFGNWIPEVRRKYQEVKEQVLSAYAAIKAILAGGTMPFSFDWSTLLVYLESKMCEISDGLYEKYRDVGNDAKAAARKSILDEAYRLPIADYVDNDFFEIYINSVKTTYEGKEGLEWRGEEKSLLHSKTVYDIEDKMEKAMRGIMGLDN